MDDDETHEDFDDGSVPDPEDPQAQLDRAWYEETGSLDPQGPPIGWKPRRRTHEDV